MPWIKKNICSMFDEGELVVATEKLHGTATFMIYHPNLNHPEMFGDSGNIVVHSKGLGASGLVFKNVPENSNNAYVKQLNKLLANGFEQKLKDLSDFKQGSVIAILGETFGVQIQDLHYGTKEPEFRVFDIKIGDDWAEPDVIETYIESLGLVMVPTLYSGPFNLEEIIKVRDGKTYLGGAHVREGVVVRSVINNEHPIHGRKIAKMISPLYLLRKDKNATEFN